APMKKPFETLVGSVFSQQLSVAGALTLYNRFKDHLPRKRMTARGVHDALAGGLDEDTIRHCGLSRQKRSYLVDLSDHVLRRKLQLTKLPQLDDEAVIEQLTQVKGIGVWTAQMYLMFNLCRPDVLPVADLGLQEGIRVAYGLDERPTAKQMPELCDHFAPYRTVASWYLWRSKEG
ncbi:MAG: hypothetical protein AAGK78_15385, partial [Planctomycetota bacterium]